MRSATGFLLLALLLGLTLPAVAAEPATSCVTLHPSVLVAPGEGLAVYVPPEGGLVAIQADTGREVWRLATPLRPVYVGGGTLLAQPLPPVAGTLEIVRYQVPEAPSGEGASPKERDRAKTPLPPDVVPSLEDDAHRIFRLGAIAKGTGEVLLWWRDTTLPRRGSVEPGGEIPRPLTRRGGVHVTLGTKLAVEALDEGAIDARLDPPVPEGAGKAIRATGWLGQPYRKDDVLSVPRVETTKDGPAVVLHRWDATSGEAKEDVVLERGPFRPSNTSADGACLLVVREDRQAPPDGRYLWRLHDVATGRAVGAVSASLGGAPFEVVGSTLLLVLPPSVEKEPGGAWVSLPPRLLARDLATGGERWRRGVRDPVPRRPGPPR